ncbi:MAG: hypothetical protein RMK74_12935 [Myxococcales bacterium]|nr:hypothetical protein [Myxococcales bacterium]
MRDARRTCPCTLAVLSIVTTAAGCLSRDLAPLHPCTVATVSERIRSSDVEAVDLLLVIDNSNSMQEEQRSLGEQIPRLIRMLTRGDRDDDGRQDFRPARSLHVGVVSTDMGTRGYRVHTCANPDVGDDGRLRGWDRRRGDCPVAPETGRFGSFLDFEPGVDPDAAARDVACVAAMGTGGCGFEQQLEAALKAVSTSEAPIAFWDPSGRSTGGHADGANAGFLRPDSVLAILLLTDEEDCSMADPRLADPNESNPHFPGDLNLRCFQYPHAAHPVERYVQGLLASRPTSDRLVFAAITGVPVDAVDEPGEVDEPADFDRLLADPRMQERLVPDPTRPGRMMLAPSCEVAGRGKAVPPRRIVRVAGELMRRGAGAVVQSICQSDYGPALDRLVDRIADALGGACLPRPLHPDATGRVPCEVVEWLPATGPITRCEQLPGREAAGMDPDTGRARCRIVQRVMRDGRPPQAPGWYYDTESVERAEQCGPSGRRIAFTEDARPPAGSEVRLECLQPVSRVPEGVLDVGSPCGGIASCSAGQTLTEGTCARTLVCDPVRNEWVVPCRVDADCEAEDLAGFRCDPSRGACVHPTC